VLDSLEINCICPSPGESELWASLRSRRARPKSWVCEMTTKALSKSEGRVRARRERSGTGRGGSVSDGEFVNGTC
jgi:hypothetical protein